MSNDERLKIIASDALKTLFSSGSIVTPVTSFDLLARIISQGPPKAGLLPGPDAPPTFRLTDLALFDEILQCFSEEWSEGKMVLSRDNQVGETTVLDVQLGQTSKGQAAASSAFVHGKKRKRVVDEDADSASGAQQEEDPGEELECKKVIRSTLDSLSPEMREVYSLLQRGTAKGKLIAEQVCLQILDTYHAVSLYIIHSSIPQTLASNLSARTLQRRSVSKHGAPRVRILIPLMLLSATASTSVHSFARIPIPH